MTGQYQRYSRMVQLSSSRQFKPQARISQYCYKVVLLDSGRMVESIHRF